MYCIESSMMYYTIYHLSNIIIQRLLWILKSTRLSVNKVKPKVWLKSSFIEWYQFVKVKSPLTRQTVIWRRLIYGVTNWISLSLMLTWHFDIGATSIIDDVLFYTVDYPMSFHQNFFTPWFLAAKRSSTRALVPPSVCPAVVKTEFLTVWSTYDSLWQLMTAYDN